MSVQSPIQNNETSKVNQELPENTFTMFSNELVDYLSYCDLTGAEFRLTMAIAREIIGYHLNEKIIKTETFLKRCRFTRQNFNRTMKAFLKKGLIERTTVNADKGEYNYFFSERLVSVINCSKNVKHKYFYAGKVIHNPENAYSGRLLTRTQGDDGGGVNLSTHNEPENPPEPAPIADPQGSEKNSKETLKKEKKFLRGGIEESFTQSNKEGWIKKPSEWERRELLNRQSAQLLAQEQREKYEQARC